MTPELAISMMMIIILIMMIIILIMIIIMIIIKIIIMIIMIIIIMMTMMIIIMITKYVATFFLRRHLVLLNYISRLSYVFICLQVFLLPCRQQMITCGAIYPSLLVLFHTALSFHRGMSTCHRL